MKIKNKLTLIYTFIFSLLLIGLNLGIYFISRSFTINSFYSELKDRALISATVFLEADEQNNGVINSFQNKYLRTLPGEILRIYNDKNQSAFIDSSGALAFSNDIVNEIRRKKEIHFEKDGRQVVGIFYQDNQGDFVIVASAIDQTGIKYLSELKNILLLGFIVSTIIVFLSGRYFTKLILKPISLISAQANNISETNLHLRLNEGNKKDELAELSITINKMLSRLEGAFELQKNFVSNASHELRTPLTSIIGNIEVTLTKARTIEEYKAVLDSIMLEAEKLHKLTNGLLDLAQSNLDFSNLIKDEIRLDELLIELKDEMHIKRPDTKININFPEMPENPASLIIPGNRSLFQIAIFNVLDNACKFSDGKIVSASLIINSNSKSIVIKDNGIGIEENEVPYVIETFYRAPNARTYAGSGIGLALANKIIHLHGGEMKIISSINNGTEVFVDFINS